MAQMLTQIGKYRVERELGHGAMGVVYKAFDPVVERPVAIKTIRLDVEEAEELLHRLRREAKSVGALEHPNIVTLYDAGESAGLFYLAMQFIQGETLQDRLTRQRWFSLKEVRDLFAQICAGLDYAHQHSVVHRDIKPANIMITAEGVVKLTDFGIAKLAGTGTSVSGLIVGTPSYMSPEQALGRPLDGRSDIFSLGCILYELITGEKAFPGQNVTTVMYKIVHEAPTSLRAIQPGLDPAVEGLVLKALAKNPGERFQTCREFAAALELYINQAISPVAQTAVALVPPLASGAGAPAIPPPAPAAVQPTWSAAAPPVAPTTPATVSQTLPGRAAVPLAWGVGGGVLGTLLLVVVILLIAQMRRPAPVNAPTSAPAVSSSQSAPQAASQATTASAQEPASSTTQQAAAGSAQPAPAPTSDHAGALRPTRAQGQPHPREAVPKVSPQKTIQTQPAPPPAAAPAEGESFNSLLLKGDLAFQQSHYQDALAAYERAYKLNSASREVRRKLVLVLTLLGRAEEARKYQ